MGFRFLDEERGWSFPGLLIAYDLVLCGELEEDLKVMMAHFVEVCGRRCLKVNTDKIKVMVPEFEYLGCVLNESGTDEADCRRYVIGVIISLVNARGLQLECARVLYEGLFVPVLLYHCMAVKQ